ncbi:MAG: hypothetical protein ACRES7_03240 [Gammaproteobacteria bacterium]
MRKQFFNGKRAGFSVFSFAAALALTLPAFAVTQSQAAQPVRAVPLASVTGPAVTILSPIVVTGNKLYLPVALQMIKAALKRPVSFRQQDLDKLVCQFTGITGSHFQTLDCRTNCQRWRQHEAAAFGVHVSSQLCDSGNSSVGIVGPGQMAATVVNWTDQHPVNRGALLELLKKLPPANSNYTLRITDHGKVVAEYVFKHGNLVSVREIKHEK